MADLRTKEVNDLLKVLATLNDETTIYALLQDLFTVREIRETSQRLAVASLLAKKHSYLAIEAETGASATTIARVSKCLTADSGGYRAALAVLDDAEHGIAEGTPDAPDDDSHDNAINTDAPNGVCGKD